MEQTGFIIAGSDLLFGLGLKSIISEKNKNQLFKTAYDKNELRNVLTQQPKSIVIVDVNSFQCDISVTIPILLENFKQSRWLLIAETISEPLIELLTGSAGRINFVLKSNSYEIISDAIFNTIQNSLFFCSEVLQVIIEGRTKKTEKSEKRNNLTHTEIEMIQLFASGRTAKEIADVRCLSFHTVNTHRKNIFRKVNVNNVQELIKYAMKNNLIDLTEYYI